jgi:hypothetical protein
LADWCAVAARCNMDAALNHAKAIRDESRIGQ